MPEHRLALPGVPCRGCGRPYGWLDLSCAGFCQRCGLVLLQRLVPRLAPADAVLEVEAVGVDDA